MTEIINRFVEDGDGAGPHDAKRSDVAIASGAAHAPLTILIHGLNYAPDFTGIAKYTTEMAEWLAARGHDVHVATAPPYYPVWKTPKNYSGSNGEEFDLNGVTVRRHRIYVPSKPTGRRRLLHYFSWLASSYFATIARARRIKPDVVISIVPSLIGAPTAWSAARLSGAACMIHIQDFEVEVAAAAGLFRQGLLTRLGLFIERWVIGRFDIVSTISPEMVRALKRKGLDASRCFEFRNWVDLDAIAVRPEGTSPTRARLGVEPDDILCVYAGAISNKQGLQTVVDAARKLADAPNVKIAVFGEGPVKAQLMKAGHGLDNLGWGAFATAEEFPDLLAAADVHLLPQLADAADLVLPSKLTAMLASGRPIVAGARAGTGLAREIDGCGVRIEPQDADAMANAVRRLAGDADLRRRLGAAARRRAEASWSKHEILRMLERQLRQFRRAAPVELARPVS